MCTEKIVIDLVPVLMEISFHGNKAEKNTVYTKTMNWKLGQFSPKNSTHLIEFIEKF